jgi:hypothetical protein
MLSPAISLNEIFLSMGFKSRCVFCFKGAKRDCGLVINVVYLPSQEIGSDGCRKEYLCMDEMRNPLRVAEVRQRLIEGLLLVLNQDANYYEVPVTKDHYLYHFMQEHIYCCICSLNSEYDSQTRVSGKIMP